MKQTNKSKAIEILPTITYLTLKEAKIADNETDYKPPKMI
jgi:hypothetical protein